MANDNIKTLHNVKRIEIKTQEQTVRKFAWETATKIGSKATISKGSEAECRKLNTVYAKVKSDDIVTGYEITVDSQTFEPEVVAIIDGGILVFDVVDTTKVIGYNAPVAGTPINRTPFDISFYSEDYDTSGNVKGYTKVTYKNCKGSPMEIEFEDGKFTAPKLNLTSAPKKGESPVTFEFVDTLA